MRIEIVVNNFIVGCMRFCLNHLKYNTNLLDAMKRARPVQPERPATLGNPAGSRRMEVAMSTTAAHESTAKERDALVERLPIDNFFFRFYRLKAFCR